MTNKPEPLDLEALREKCAESDAILIETAKVRSLIAEVERLRSNQSHLEEIAGDSRDRNARLKAALEPFAKLAEIYLLPHIKYGEPDMTLVDVEFPLAHLRTAAAALAEGEG